MTAATMRAAVLTGAGGPEMLSVEAVGVPRPGPEDVLVRVAAFGVNNADALQRRGVMPAPPSGIPGLECAGHVVATGPAVDTVREGDRVLVLARHGTYAEFAVAAASACLRVPAGLDLVSAAAVPEAAATTWWNLVRRGRLQAGERVLVHGAAGGVGSFAVQAARALGARVVGTARGPDKVALCAGLGCDDVIDYGSTDVWAAARSLAPGGFDVILDNQGGPAVAANMSLLAPFGRLVVIGVQAGGAASFDVGDLMGRAAEVSSSSLGRLDDAVRAQICTAVARDLLPLVADGTITVVIDSSFALDDVVSAHRRFDAAQRRGKVIVTVDDAA